MFDDEEQPNEFFEGSLKEDLEKFESFLKGDTIGFFDTDRWEAMIDHYLIAAQYSKALLCVEQALSATGNLKEALNLLTEIERSDVPSMEVLLSKASVFSQLKDTKNAIKYFKGAIIEAAPEDRDEIYLDLAMEYQNNDEYQLAINVLIEAVNANKSNEGAIYELAYCYDQIGDTDR
jgi:tetratricopeptide (TPR) repeat protein